MHKMEKPILGRVLRMADTVFRTTSVRTIRPFTLGLKSWLFSDSPQGATASATVYNIVEMAKANGLNIY